MKSILKKQGFVNALASILAIICGLVFGLLILIIANPSQAFAGLGYLIRGGFSGGMKGLGEVLYYATPIIMTGLAVGFAFKTGLFNIGATGQFLAGAFVAIYIGVEWTFLPGALHWIVAVICGTLAGGVLGLVPGVFKAYLNVHEVISSIMMNYISLYGLNFAMKKTVIDNYTNQTQNVAETAVIPSGFLDQIFSNPIANTRSTSSLTMSIFIAIGAALVRYVILNKTVFGYELKACGYNEHASKYAGISSKRNIVLSMAISGMLAGMGGALLFLCNSRGRHIEVIDALMSEGFNGIPVALLGLNNPIGIVFAGIFVAHLTVAGSYMQALDYVPEIVDMIIAVIIYCSAFGLVFRGVIVKLLTGTLFQNNRKSLEREGN